MLTSRPVQGSRSMVIDMSAARCSTPSMPLAASISCGSRITSPCTSFRRASPCRCLRFSAEPWKKLSSTTTAAAPSSSSTSADAEPTRLAPPTIRNRLPLMGSAWDFAADLDVALIWGPPGLDGATDRSLPTMTRPTRHRKAWWKMRVHWRAATRNATRVLSSPACLPLEFFRGPPGTSDPLTLDRAVWRKPRSHGVRCAMGPGH